MWCITVGEGGGVLSTLAGGDKSKAPVRQLGDGINCRRGDQAIGTSACLWPTPTPSGGMRTAGIQAVARRLWH